MTGIKAKLLKAALPHVAFDGWGDAALEQAARECGIGMPEARAEFPRGGIDMALEFHRQGDAALADLLRQRDLAGLRYSERVAEAVWLRLELAEPSREAVRRGVTMFSLPVNAPEGAKAIWATADTIWTGLGDTSTDINWYSKRALLAAVFSASLLYWLGDTSPASARTREFIDRRIANVMKFEELKAKFRASAFGKAVKAGPGQVLDRVRAPARRDDLPGSMR